MQRYVKLREKQNENLLIFSPSAQNQIYLICKLELRASIHAPMTPARSPSFNTGMFTAMMEAGDVMATFVGHDHDNDYTVMWHDILLGYGRYSGGNTVYNHLTHGARVIILKEGLREFDTYIREINGSCVNHATYPTSWK